MQGQQALASAPPIGGQFTGKFGRRQCLSRALRLERAHHFLRVPMHMFNLLTTSRTLRVPRSGEAV